MLLSGYGSEGFWRRDALENLCDARFGNGSSAGDGAGTAERGWMGEKFFVPFAPAQRELIELVKFGERTDEGFAVTGQSDGAGVGDEFEAPREEIKSEERDSDEEHVKHRVEVRRPSRKRPGSDDGAEAEGQR